MDERVFKFFRKKSTDAKNMRMERGEGGRRSEGMEGGGLPCNFCLCAPIACCISDL